MPLDRWTKYKLPIDVDGFGGALGHLNGKTELTVELWQLVWSAVMVGFPSFMHLTAPPGFEAWWTCMHRVSIVKGFLSGDGDDYLGYSGSFSDADASEKAVINYYLRLIAAKLVAGEHLDIWNLRHYDAFYEQVHRKRVTGSRPDLVGFGMGGWYVVEAKGRQVARADVIRSALAQAEAHHPHSPAATPLASIACLRSHRWTVLWRVPHVAGQSGRTDALMRTALTAYYAPVVDTWRQRRAAPVDNQYPVEDDPDSEHVAAAIPNVDVTIVIPLDIVEAVDEQFRSVDRPDDWMRQWADRAPKVAVRGGQNSLFASDGIGISIGPSWDLN